MPADVARLAERFGLGSAVALQLARLWSLLIDDPLAPTTVRRPQQVLDDHLADSLVALDVPGVREVRSAVDIGSGAGLPGLPLAMALRQARFVLLESSARKAAFIQRAANACEVVNVEVVSSRVEDWSAGPAGLGLVTCRAVAALEVVVEYAAPLLAVGGRLIAWRGIRDLQAEQRATRAAELVGLQAEDVCQVWPYPTARARYLHLFLKVRPTPPEFPRRAGVASKRPLGG